MLIKTSKRKSLGNQLEQKKYIYVDTNEPNIKGEDLSDTDTELEKENIDAIN